jgi:hypothetical protein
MVNWKMNFMDQGSMLRSQFSAIFDNFRRKHYLCYDIFLPNLALLWVKNINFCYRKYFLIITSVPDYVYKWDALTKFLSSSNYANPTLHRYGIALLICTYLHTNGNVCNKTGSSSLEPYTMYQCTLYLAFFDGIKYYHTQRCVGHYLRGLGLVLSSIFCAWVVLSRKNSLNKLGVS